MAFYIGAPYWGVGVSYDLGYGFVQPGYVVVREERVPAPAPAPSRASYTLSNKNNWSGDVVSCFQRHLTNPEISNSPFKNVIIKLMTGDISCCLLDDDIVCSFTYIQNAVGKYYVALVMTVGSKQHGKLITVDDCDVVDGNMAETIIRNCGALKRSAGL
jgi:hypothetical protein